jgi:hypothetical protein
MISVFISFWTLFSSGTQWWFATNIPEMLSSICLLFVSSIYFLNSTKISSLIISISIFTYFGIFFGLTLYPPYLIPLGYFFIFISIGYLADNFKKEIIFSKLLFKSILVLSSILATGIVFYLYILDIKPIIELIGNTVYPGKRLEFGGTGFTASAFSEYYSLFINGEKFPKEWSNICELSHYLTFFPIIVFGVAYCFIKRIKVPKLVFFLLIFQLIGYAWMYIRFPEFLAKISLLFLVPPYRLMIPLGISNVFLTGIFLSNHNILFSKRNWTIRIIIIIVSFLFIYSNSQFMNSSVNNFFKPHQILISSILIAACYYSLIFKNDSKYYTYLFILIISAYWIHNTTVNPISRGLSPIRQNSISKAVIEINEKDPGKWVVFGQFTFSDFLTSSGLDVISGVKFVPMYKEMKILDPELKKDSTFNRYAHISFYPYIDGKDSVIFNLIQSDAYAIQMDPCGEKIKKLGIKYVLFTYTPQPSEIRCMIPLVNSNINIYKIQ